MNDRKKIAQFILLMFITGLLLYLCWLMFAPFMSVILWSAILVIIFHPLYRKIHSKIKIHSISAVITIIVSFLTFIIPLMLISAAAVNEIAGFAGTAIDWFKNFIADPEHSQLGYLYKYLSGFVNLEEAIKPEDIKALASRISEIMLSASWYVVEGVFGTIAGFMFAVFAMYYLFRDGEKIVKDMPSILPMDNNEARELISEISDLISATIRGSLFVAVLQGTLAGIIFWMLGIPSYVLLGLITMLFSLIPTGGTAFVTVPIIIVLLIYGDYWKAIVLAAYAALVIGMIDNFLLPKLIKQRAKMNELFVFFSVLGGIQLFGIIGLFMGPIILAIAIGLLTVFKGEKINKETISMQ